MRGTTLRRRDSTPLAELGRLASPARRTTTVRIGLALALAAVVALAVSSARSAGSGRAAVLPTGATTGVVVLDMSASIAGPVYERVATLLKGIVSANQAIGLVMFSDVAYELLPPNSPPGALLEFLRFFQPQGMSNGAPVFGKTPWDQFSGGTRIASGLVMGAAALRRAGVKHGALLLVSDLDDSSADLEPLDAAAVQLKKEHIPVRIVPLFADPQNVQIFASLFGSSAFVDPRAFTHRAGRQVQSVSASPPWALIGLGLLLVLLLAANERLNTRVEIGAAA